MSNTDMIAKANQETHEKEKASNIRYIRAKLPSATASDLAIIAAVVRELYIAGWSDNEYFREI